MGEDSPSKGWGRFSCLYRSHKSRNCHAPVLLLSRLLRLFPKVLSRIKVLNITRTQPLLEERGMPTHFPVALSFSTAAIGVRCGFLCIAYS